MAAWENAARAARTITFSTHRGADMNEQSNDTGNDKSFAELMEDYDAGPQQELRVGDKVSGAIVSIGETSVFVDAGAKLDGVVEKDELLDENGELPYQEGDVLELYVVSMKGNELTLSRALTGAGGLEMLEQAKEQDLPVEGKVVSTCKGGFNVEVMHRRAFCPISQIDDAYVEDPEPYVGQEYRFLINTLEQHGRNIVVSRRRLLEQEKQEAAQEFQDAVEPGMELEGRVMRLEPFGAFVEVAPGVEGLVHVSEISWSRVGHPEEAVSVGDTLRVKVLGVEQEAAKGKRPPRLRVSLSAKQAQADPWEDVAERFEPGQSLPGTVKRLAPFGAFVEVAPGIEGLVHISEMSYTKRVLKPEDEVREGETVTVQVKEVDPERRRLSLSLRDAAGDPWLAVPEKYKPGQKATGTLEKQEAFGLFVNLEPGVTGLLPKSKLSRASNAKELEKLNPGDPVPVVVEEVRPDERKITLGPADAREAGDWKQYAADKPQAAPQGLGTLGEKLRQAMKDKGE
jgi:small subunit ribosomal protein S1